MNEIQNAEHYLEVSRALHGFNRMSTGSALTKLRRIIKGSTNQLLRKRASLLRDRIIIGE